MVAGACRTFAGACRTFAGACHMVAGACRTFAGACHMVAGACRTMSPILTLICTDSHHNNTKCIYFFRTVLKLFFLVRLDFGQIVDGPHEI